MLTLFCCLWTFLLFVVLVGLLGLAYASFLLMRIILLFMFTCRNLLVKSPLYGDVSEKPMMGMIYPFSIGILTFVKMIETFVKSLGHRTRMIHSSGLLLFFW
jgi:hypothetical protein